MVKSKEDFIDKRGSPGEQRDAVTELWTWAGQTLSYACAVTSS